MKFTILHAVPRDWERLLWVVSVAILAGGYFTITHRYERQIVDSTQRSQALYERTVLNRRIISQSGRVRALRTELRARLNGVFLSPRPAEATAALLRDLDALARQHNALVMAVSPQDRAKPLVSPSAAPSHPVALQNEEVDISIRGHFSDLLALIAQMPRQHSLLRVSQVSFSLSNATRADSSRPLLDAKVHTFVYHVTGKNVLGER